MSRTYAPLERALREAAGRGPTIVEFDFDAIATLVGRLPASVDATSLTCAEIPRTGPRGCDVPTGPWTPRAAP